MKPPKVEADAEVAENDDDEDDDHVSKSALLIDDSLVQTIAGMAPNRYHGENGGCFA